MMKPLRHGRPRSALLLLALLPSAATAATRPLRVDDLYRLKDVADPRVSPDGRWVAFTVTSLDAEKDESDADVSMAPLAGGDAVRLTTSAKSETDPRWSPDGRFLAFLSSREGKKAQVWLLDRRGGEAERLTALPGGVSGLAWSPDGTRLVLVASDPDPDEADDGEDQEASAPAKKEKRPKPLVIRRLQFKRDGEGFLRERRSHLHVFDLRTRASVQVTSGPYDDSEPAWSPDGRLLAFTSNRTDEPDANVDSDVFVVEPRPGAVPRRVTTSPGTDGSPAFSPDGAWIAYVAGGDPKDIWYATSHVALVPAGGGAPRPLTQSLDRNVLTPRFTPDGRAVLFILEDGGNKHLCRVPVAGGAVERVVAGERDVQAFDVGPKGEIAVLESQVHQPPEVSAVVGGRLERVSRVNDAFLGEIRLGPVERFRAKSPDGTTIDGFLVRPPDAAVGARVPTILRIHGGPVDQFSTEFNFEWQVLAAQGYAVVGANPRGSSGYGRDFARAIWADWGNKDYEDVMAAVDHAIAAGTADPDRLGVFGWSYGGILTNYVITKTNRFKAAMSGASEANYLANYGHDHYQREWEAELGLPWKATELWLRLSPWLDVEQVETPTLVVCGQEDWNVPLLNSEQLYQALRRLGIPTELVVYPGEDHSIDRPSFRRDRLERYVAWFDRYVKGESAPPAPPPASEATSLLGVPLFSPALTGDEKSRLEENLAKATADFVKDPDDPEHVIWLGRRLAYLGRFREAIAVFTRGIGKHPQDVRLYRHRGHRRITVREMDEAVADLEKAAEIIRTGNLPDQVEPDGAPNALGVPTSTSHFNVYYHLGLALYLKGDFEGAAAAYRECLKFSAGSPDRLVATSDWLYLTLRRLGRAGEAAAVLDPIRPDLDVIEDQAYLDRLLLYKGLKAPGDLLAKGDDPVSGATYAYGVGAWHLVNGRSAKAREAFERALATPQWAAFAVIASEAELVRMR